MECFKGTIIGLAIGMVVGAIIGATNCEMVHNAIKQSKKEIKRFKRKINLVWLRYKELLFKAVPYV